MEKIVLKPNRFKVVSKLVACVFLILLGFFNLLYTNSTIEENLYLYMLNNVVFSFCIIFFVYWFYIILVLGFFRKDFIIFDEKGITDNSTEIAFGFVPWSDVDIIMVNNLASARFVEVKLKNPNKYIAKLSEIKQNQVRLNMKMKHEAMCINLSLTNTKPRDIISKVKKLFETYKR